MASLNYSKKGKSCSIYNKPDYDDCLKKVCYGTAYGALIGSVISVYDSVGYSRPNSLIGSAKIWASHTTLMAGAGAAYMSGVVICAGLRKKDDPVNHFFGGLAAGAVFGARTNSQKVGWGLGITFGLVASTLKLFHQSGIELLPFDKIRQEKAFFDYRRSYFTERPNPEGNPEI